MFEQDTHCETECAYLCADKQPHSVHPHFDEVLHPAVGVTLNNRLNHYRRSNLNKQTNKQTNKQALLLLIHMMALYHTMPAHVSDHIVEWQCREGSQPLCRGVTGVWKLPTI